MNEKLLLTERFIELFKRSSEDGNTPYDLVAEVLDVTIKTIKRYEQKIELITHGDAYLLCQNLGWSFDFMFQDITNWEDKVADELEIGFSSLTSVKAGYSTRMNEPRVTILNNKVTKGIIRHKVDGDSMFIDDDGIEDGDLLETERISQLNDISENKTYVVITDEGNRVKKLRFSRNHKGKINGFYLHSNLSQVFPVEHLIGNERIEVYKVITIIKESKRKFLRTGVGNDKIKMVLDVLIKTFENTNSFEELNNLTILKGRFTSLTKDFTLGLSKQKYFDQNKNKIRAALLDFINEIDEKRLTEIDTSSICTS